MTVLTLNRQRSTSLRYRTGECLSEWDRVGVKSARQDAIKIFPSQSGIEVRKASELAFFSLEVSSDEKHTHRPTDDRMDNKFPSRDGISGSERK